MMDSGFPPDGATWGARDSATAGRRFVLPSRTVRRMFVALVVACVAGLFVESAVANGAQLSCGDVITEDLTLAENLVNCENGLVVGADGITIDLAEHTIEGLAPLFFCEGDCIGIDNRAGHDGVRIVGGTVAGFKRGIVFDGGDNGELSSLVVDNAEFAWGATPGQSFAVDLQRSDRTHIDGLAAGGGLVGLQLLGSDDNTVVRSDLGAGIGVHSGDEALSITGGSDGNRVIDSRIDSEGSGFSIAGSDNTLTRVRASAHASNFIGGSRNRVVDSVISGGQGVGILVGSAEDTTVERSEITDGAPLWVSRSTRTRLVRNLVKYAFYGIPFIQVHGGDATVILGNVVEGADSGGYGGGDGILVGATAAGVTLLQNSVTGATDDGFAVEAPGTVVRANTAADNADLGIEAVQGVVDGGGNRAARNGNPEQCSGVTCLQLRP